MAPKIVQVSFCIQVYTSKFPIDQSFQSCDPEEPSFQAGNEYKQSSHLSVCGRPRCKQITQPGQTHEVPASNPNGDRTNYDSAGFPGFKMSLTLEKYSVYKSLAKEKPHHQDFHSHIFHMEKAKQNNQLAVLCSKLLNSLILEQQKFNLIQKSKPT